MANGADRDIFGYSRTSAAPMAAFDPVDSILTIAGASTFGYLVQQWNVTYDQDVAEVFELGSDSVYWVKGRPTGRGTIRRVIGLAGDEKTLFPPEAFDVCEGGATMRFHIGVPPCYTESSLGGKEDLNIEVAGVLVTHIGFEMNAPSGQGGAQALLNEDLQFRFAFMNIT